MAPPSVRVLLKFYCSRFFLRAWLKLGDNQETFWQFLTGMRATIARVFATFYFKTHGQSEETQKSLKATVQLMLAAQMLRIVFWMFVLGPVVFTFFYAFSIAYKSINYAHFNYSTHAWRGDHTEIINLHETLFYKFLNSISFGLFWHKNHHDYPNLFNPSKAGVPEQKAVSGS
jgi:stearoyl-CoA desaturase (delta-9 desaturase)